MKNILKNNIVKIMILIILIPLYSFLAYRERSKIEPDGFEVPPYCLQSTGNLVEKVNNSSNQNIIALKNDKPLNDAIQLFLTSFLIKQETYYQFYGKYFQGLEKVDRIENHPRGWIDLGIDRFSLPFSVRVSEYKTPDNNCGWQAYFSVMIGENKYEKSIGKGPNASDYGYDWQYVEKPY